MNAKADWILTVVNNNADLARRIKLLKKDYDYAKLEKLEAEKEVIRNDKKMRRVGGQIKEMRRLYKDAALLINEVSLDKTDRSWKRACERYQAYDTDSDCSDAYLSSESDSDPEFNTNYLVSTKKRKIDAYPDIIWPSAK
jgi:hypothetical protein